MDTWSSDKKEEPAQEPACPICGGIGFVYRNVPVGHPKFGDVVPCKCAKEELSNEQKDRLERYSNLAGLTHLTFDNLIPDGRSGKPKKQERFRQAYDTARMFAIEPKGWLVLIGPSGCGKTHLAAAIANQRISQGYPALFQSIPDLLDHLRSTFGPHSEVAYDELVERVSNAPLLILDDLGIQAGTPWAKEKLDQLLNHRFNVELPTVITTGIPVDELDDRIRTRVTDPRISTIYVIAQKPTLLLEYGWGPEFELQKTMTFENFDHRRVNLRPEQRENLENAYHLALDFANSPEGWLVFMGETGCGKTHLASAIVNYRYQSNNPALFIVVPDFLDHLRSTFSPESKVSYDQLFENVKTAPLLVLDDFGEQSTTPWAKEKLYQVINYRYNARLATVFTTRYTLEDIQEGIASSIGSRMVDPKISMPFNIMAPDYRGDTRSNRGSRTTRRGSKQQR